MTLVMFVCPRVLQLCFARWKGLRCLYCTVQQSFYQIFSKHQCLGKSSQVFWSRAANRYSDWRSDVVPPGCPAVDASRCPVNIEAEDIQSGKKSFPSCWPCAISALPSNFTCFVSKGFLKGAVPRLNDNQSRMCQYSVLILTKSS